jgi:hypothetical protein
MELWKIRMKTTSAGPDGVKQTGKEYQVTPEEGKQLVPVYADLVWKPEEAKKEPVEEKPEFPKSLSPGRWELSNGKIIQGKKAAAIEAENALKG